MTQQDYNPNVLLTIQTTLSQYPILTEKIENEMYSRLVSDGYITVSSFSEKVRDFALLTQKREGLENPFAQEPTLVWEKRLERVRSMMICQEFAHSYTLDTFNSIVESVVREPSSGSSRPAFMWHNIQHATIETIIEQALTIEHLPVAERKQYEPQLMAAKVTLIRRMLSNRIPYISIAKEVFSIHDLLEINRHRIGRGLIGSKAAELMLANRILHNSVDDEIRNAVGDIESIFIGSDVFYNFMMINNLMGWYDQKYKDENEKLRTQVMDTLLAAVDFPLPEKLLAAETAHVKEQLANREKQHGKKDDEIAAMDADLAKQADTQARMSLRREFLISAIAKEEKVEVTFNDLIPVISEIAQREKKSIQQVVKALRDNRQMDVIGNSLMFTKTVDKIISLADITVVKDQK